MNPIKRRIFLRNTMLTGIGTSLKLPSDKSHTESATANDQRDNADSRNLTPNGKKVIVAGAGITGLCCGYELMKKGFDVVVLEASGRHGGHVFTGKDGLSDGLYADFGADHITRPGYERFFEYINEFGLTPVPYPNAEGSRAAEDKHALHMVDGKFYSREMLSDPSWLKKAGYNDKEVAFLSAHPSYELSSFYVGHYLDRFKDEAQPFGVGYDDLDKVAMSDIFRKEGASAAAISQMGGHHTSALYYLWRMAIMKMRGIPLSEGETFHLKGGNQEMPNAFARKLGERVLLNHPILAIKRDEQGVAVTYRAYGYEEQKEMHADFLVNTIPLPIFRNIPVTPALGPQKQYVVDNLTFSSHPFYVFEASSKFWLEDGLKSINMEFEHPDISSIWMETNEVDSPRVILKAYGPGGLSPQRVLAAFRKLYPGKRDTIVQALTVDWTKDRFAPTCEMEPFPVGEMHKFWPEIMKPDGRIYFAGTYADPMSRGMESCLRSANRVATEIHSLRV